MPGWLRCLSTERPWRGRSLRQTCKEKRSRGRGAQRARPRETIEKGGRDGAFSEGIMRSYMKERKRKPFILSFESYGRNRHRGNVCRDGGRYLCAGLSCENVVIPLTWSEELGKFLFVWITWLGISLGERKGEHIKITMPSGQTSALPGGAGHQHSYQDHYDHYLCRYILLRNHAGVFPRWERIMRASRSAFPVLSLRWLSAVGWMILRSVWALDGRQVSV